MKYFLPFDAQSISMDEAFDIAGEQARNYETYLEGVRQQIPSSLLEVVDDVNFGDYLIEKLHVDLQASYVSIEIIGERIEWKRSEHMYVLKYSQVSQINIVNHTQGDPSPFITGVLEVTNHEIEVLESGLFEFRFAFVGRAEMAIRFREFEFEQNSFEQEP